MLREIPDRESGHNDDYERYWFEVQRQEWEAEEREERIMEQQQTAHLHYCPICQSLVGAALNTDCHTAEDHELLEPCADCLAEHPDMAA